MKRFPLFFILFLAVFALSACKSREAIRTLKATRTAYNKKNFKQIDRLKEATTVINRDIACTSAYYLAKYIDVLDKAKPKKELTAEMIEAKRQDIYKHLKKLYSINGDFNMRNICIQGVARVRSQETVDFLVEALDLSDPVNLETALLMLKPYIMDGEFDTSAGIEKTIKILSKADPFLVHTAVENLLLYTRDAAITSALENYREISDDLVIKNIISKGLAASE